MPKSRLLAWREDVIRPDKAMLLTCIPGFVWWLVVILKIIGAIHWSWTFIVILVLPVLVLEIMCFVVYWVIRRKKRQKTSIPFSGKEPE